MEGISENPYAEFDRYDLRHYLAHLERAGRGDQVHEVLLRESRELERPAKKRLFRRAVQDDPLPVLKVANAWYAAHEDIGETESYLSDVTRCWRLAHQKTAHNLTDRGLVPAVALEARYALISSCVNNLAANIPPPLLTAAIKQGLITSSQGLAYARQTPDLPQQAVALAGVGQNLEPNSEATVLLEALTTAEAISDQTTRASTLAALANQVPADQLQRAIQIASEILFPNDRLQALLGLVSRLTEEVKDQVLQQASAIVEELKEESEKAEALIAIACNLPIPLQMSTFERALNLLEQSEANYRQAEAIENFIRVAPDSMLERAVALAKKIEMEESRITALSPLAARIASQGDIKTALRLIQNISPERYGLQRASALQQAAPHLSPDGIRGAIEMAFEILVEQYRSIALAGLAPYLTESLLNNVLRRAKAMKEAMPRAIVLTALIPLLAGRKKDDALNVVTTAVQENLSNVQRDVLTALAPYLCRITVKRLFDAARNIDDYLQQIQAIAALASSLNGEAKSLIADQLLRQVSNLQDATQRAQAYVSILPVLLETGELTRALEIARSLRPWRYFAHAITAVTTSLDPAAQKQEFQSILELLERSNDDSQTAEIIPVIASQLSEDLVLRAVALCLKANWEGGKVTALTSLARYVREEIVCRDYLSELGRVTNDFSKRKLGAAIAERLAMLGKQRDALSIACDEQDELYVVDSLEGIIPYLDEALLLEVFRISESFSYEGRKHSVFAMLASRFAELGNEEAVRYLIAEIKAPLQAALAAARVTRFAAMELRTDSIRHALVITKNMQGAFGAGQGWWQAEVLGFIGPYLSGDLVAEAWHLAVRIDEENDRYQALSSLAREHVTLVERTNLYSIWSDSLHHLAKRSRRHLLSDLKAMSPVILALSDTDGIAGIIDAIRDVGRWW